jgi:excisionase family DNA binding protein
MIAIRAGELARTLGVHRNTIRNWIKNGVLEAQPTVGKKYLIAKDRLLQFVQSKGIATTAVESLIESGLTVPAAQPVPSLNQPAIQKEAPMKQKSIGSVLVVGGGIAGIQATLDLADSGYYVYLLEKSPGIGGVMAQLDKTFPTNDCAM